MRACHRGSSLPSELVLSIKSKTKSQPSNKNPWAVTFLSKVSPSDKKKKKKRPHPVLMQELLKSEVHLHSLLLGREKKTQTKINPLSFRCGSPEDRHSPALPRMLGRGAPPCCPPPPPLLLLLQRLNLPTAEAGSHRLSSWHASDKLPVTRGSLRGEKGHRLPCWRRDGRDAAARS